MTDKLKEFLTRHHACAGGIRRLEASGAETLEQAWEKAAPADLVWGVTRPGVMSPEQRRQFFVFVLESIEDKLTDPRSKNILEKLRTNSPITEAEAEDAAAADAAEWAEAEAADAAADAAEWAEAAADAAWAAADAAWAAADAAWAEAAAEARAYAAAYAAAAVAADAAYAAAWAEDAAYAAAREKQAQWIRDNFALSDLHIN